MLKLNLVKISLKSQEKIQNFKIKAPKAPKKFTNN